MTTTAKLLLPYIAGSQDNAITNHGTGIFILDALVNCGIVDRDLNTAPAAVTGDVYIIGPAPSGAAWDPDSDGSKAGFLAIYDGAGWKIYEPLEGWRGRLLDEDIHVEHDGTSWKSLDAVFMAYDNAGGQSITGSALKVLWDTEVKEDSGCIVHPGGGTNDEIHLLEAGWYEIEYDMGVTATGTTGNNVIDARITINNSIQAGSEATVDVNSSTITHGQLHATRLVSVAAGDIARIEIIRTSGSGTIATNAKRSRVSVRRR